MKVVVYLLDRLASAGEKGGGLRESIDRGLTTAPPPVG
jgi:hypothetical protein